MRRFSEFLLENIDEEQTNEGMAEKGFGFGEWVGEKMFKIVKFGFKIPLTAGAFVVGMALSPFFSTMKSIEINSQFKKLSNQLAGDPDIKNIYKNLDSGDKKFLEKCFASLEHDGGFQDALHEPETKVEDLHQHMARILGEKDYTKFLKIQSKQLIKYPNLKDKIVNVKLI